MVVEGITNEGRLLYEKGCYTPKPIRSALTELKNVVEAIWADLPQSPN